MIDPELLDACHELLDCHGIPRKTDDHVLTLSERIELQGVALRKMCLKVIEDGTRDRGEL